MGDNRDLTFQTGAIPALAFSGCTPELTIPRRPGAPRHVGHPDEPCSLHALTGRNINMHSESSVVGKNASVDHPIAAMQAGLDACAKLHPANTRT